MSTLFESAKWIWADGSLDVDDYASFEVPFYTTREVSLRISCDSVYAIYLNNKFVTSMQCSDYPHYKLYDEIKLEAKPGKNELKIDAWHFGTKSQNYYPDAHGVIFELIEDDKVIIYSCESIKSRVINEFSNGRQKRITSQLGLSFAFDSTIAPSKTTNSVLVNKTNNVFRKREINPIKTLVRRPISVIKKEKSFIIDMGKETVGYADLEFISPETQKITVSFGEHIKDGRVRRIITSRDFSFEYTVKEGKNVFFNPLRRLAGRYLELSFEKEIDIQYAGFRPVVYQHSVIEKNISDPLLKKIYDICVYTLECCMHEHYEDCPWREQALYTLDSRNQMLCGYSAFDGYEYQKHNLLLISQDKSDNGLLSLCFPMKNEGLTIPFFSLVYIMQVYEYIEQTGDESILDFVGEKLDQIFNAFGNAIDENGLIPYFEKPLWNFYEWTKGSANDDVFSPSSPSKKDQYDLIINAMFAYIAPLYGEMRGLYIDVSYMKEAIQNTFYMKSSHLFKLNTASNESSQLGNAMAMLIGLGDNVTLVKTIESIDMVEASLSAKCFVYDALLKKDKSLLLFVINEIKDKYGKMLNEGATTVYETELGPDDFGGAGSMCHGWSSLPIHYIDMFIK